MAGVADGNTPCGVPLRAAPVGIRAVVAGERVAGRVLSARHYGSVDSFLEALGRAGAGDALVFSYGSCPAGPGATGRAGAGGA